MKNLANMKIGARMALAFAGVIGLALVVVAVGVVHLGRLADGAHEVGRQRLPKVLRVFDIVEDVNLVARELRNMLIFDDAARLTASNQAIAKSRAEIGKVFDELKPTIRSEEGRRLLAAALDARTRFVQFSEQLQTMANEGKKADGGLLLGEKVRPAQMAYLEALDKLKDYQIKMVDEAVERGASDAATARLEMLGLLAAMVVVGATMCTLVARSISRPIEDAVAIAERVAAGDLSGHVEATRRDEVGRLLAALGAMTESLAKIVGNVRASSESIATGAAQIATGNADLSQRTEEQASNLQQTAASMDQMNATVRQSAETAQQATQLANSASAVAAKGGTVVGQVVSTMGEISSSSHRIAEIIGVIDGIAFQTNILALNAAVEAARAGDQGRGFAVVASEVRSLAQRSAEAAREIRSLIAQSVEKVASGSALVADAGTTMDEIVNQVRRVADLIAEIGAAAGEQAQGIGQVTSAVSQLDQVTQQNAALVEESAAAADSLKQQASRMAEAVSVFRLAGVAGQAFATPAAVAERPTPTARRPAPAFAAARPKTAAAAPSPSAARVAPAATPAAMPAAEAESWEAF